MIILDTNVLSEVIRQTPDQRVLNWLERQPRQSTFATAISKAEMLSGAAVLPDGRRRDALERLTRQLFETQFDPALLPFDGAAAAQFAEVIAMRRRLGRPIGAMDAQIAAIARAKGAGIATRDIDGFAQLGLVLVNPWES